MIDNTIDDIIINLEHLEIQSNMKQNKYVSTCIEINNIVKVLVSIQLSNLIRCVFTCKVKHNNIMVSVLSIVTFLLKIS